MENCSTISRKYPFFLKLTEFILKNIFFTSNHGHHSFDTDNIR